MNTQEAHIAELQKQLAESKAENERLLYKVGQQKTQMVDHARQSRTHEAAQFAPIVEAARALLAAAEFRNEFGPGGVVAPSVYACPVNEIEVLRTAIENKYPTPGIYPALRTYGLPRDPQELVGGQMTTASIFAVQRGLGGVEVDAV